MPLQATSGAASYDAFGGGVPVVPNYIEEVFSTYLYSGNGSTQTITNGIDLSGKGGMTWLKSRTTAQENLLTDTTRGAGYTLVSESTGAQFLNTNIISSFTSSGFSLGGEGASNGSGKNFTSWTFRKQPKFFDVVTYTGDLIAGKTVAHNLGSVPGCIIVKRTNSTDSFWRVYHRSLTATNNLKLNLTDASVAQSTIWNDTEPTSTHFTVGTNGNVNQSGDTYVAYLFAHNAGGFGLTGTDNVISCGSFTTDAVNGNASVNLGYEPQWLLVKTTAESGNWRIVDNMRGMTVGYSNAILSANLSNAESTGSFFAPSATGFEATGLGASVPCIYIAIRRGPMKVPTVGTSVFSPNTSSSTTGTAITTGFPVDLSISQYRGGEFAFWGDRLRGINSTTSSLTTPRLRSDSTNAESLVDFLRNWGNTGIEISSAYSGLSTIYWNFRRAPSFFDEVCYTGTGSAKTVTHNLGVTPELMIVKQRGGTTDWVAYVQPLGNTVLLAPNLDIAQLTFPNAWNNTSPTSTEFTVGISGVVNASAGTYVAYLFATCAGVSKVGSYTGNGSSQTIDCGFTGGARFVLIKKSSGTGDWMVSDSARGIVSGNDPYLELNNTNAEVTGEDWLDTDSTGFVVNEVSGSNANTSSATYIFLAIA